MATKQLNARVRLKTDTAANWAASSNKLLAGEVAFCSDSKVVKIGDGSTTFANLEAVTPEAITTSEIEAILED